MFHSQVLSESRRLPSSAACGRLIIVGFFFWIGAHPAAAVSTARGHHGPTTLLHFRPVRHFVNAFQAACDVIEGAPSI